jgi:single-stranded DNA-binding protein
MTHKTHDLAVKVGEYTNSQGETKSRYQNVGALMMGDKGPFIMLAKWFNPAGVTDNRGGESILISAFEPRQDGQQAPKQRQAAPQRQQAQKPQGGGFDDMDDDIPF